MARIAVPLADDFEDSEFAFPCAALEKDGHQIVVLGSKAGETVQGKRGEVRATIDAAADEVALKHIDALLIPGGQSPDRLRLNAGLVAFTREFCATGKPVAAVCHGPQLLIEADAVQGRTLTSWPSVRTDLINAGAHWVDEAVVVDGNLITSRKPEDLPAFTEALRARLGPNSTERINESNIVAPISKGQL